MKDGGGTRFVVDTRRRHGGTDAVQPRARLENQTNVLLGDVGIDMRRVPYPLEHVHKWWIVARAYRPTYLRPTRGGPRQLQLKLGRRSDVPCRFDQVGMVWCMYTPLVAEGPRYLLSGTHWVVRQTSNPPARVQRFDLQTAPRLPNDGDSPDAVPRQKDGFST